MHENGNKNILSAIENVFDIFINSAALFAAFLFAVTLKNPGGITPESPATVLFIFIVVVFQSLVFMSLNLYRPIPFIKQRHILYSLFRVNFVYYLAVELVVILLLEGVLQEFAVVWMAIGWAVSTAFLLFKKNIIIHIIAKLRSKSYNLRKVIIVGDNTATAQDFVKQVSGNTQYGMMIIGYVGDKIHDVVGCDKLGSFKDLAQILDEYKPNDVVFAIDAYDKRHLIKLVNLCDDRCIRVFFLPVIYGFFKSARQITSVGTLPLVNVHNNPLDNGFNAFVKRLVDIIGSSILIILTLPLMIIAGIGVYISSPGPVIFRQERLGRMGKPFKMLKFRSMRVNVQSDAAWTQGDDPRKTRFGTLLRKTSLDELPQLFNVLFGSMSLVGPRPEIPKFVEEFREQIPLYMVKHYVKPGMTGLAQVRGLRGDTSVEERILADIEYIESWSLLSDFLILLKTPFKAFNKNEKYVAELDDVPLTNAPVEEILQAPMLNEELVVNAVNESKPVGKRLLYVASSMMHINNFHLPYIEKLREDGYEVKILARGDGADYNVPFEKKFFSASNKACRHEIRNILKHEKFDVILLNTTLAAFHVRLCLPKKNRPRVVNIVHGYLFSSVIGRLRSAVLLLCEKRVASRTDAIIVMNREDERSARRYRLCRGEVYYSLGMGATIKPHEISPEKLRKELLCQDKYVMAFVGELSQRKNQEFLITSLIEVKERIPNAVLWLVGDGVARDSLTALAGRVDLSESVFFLGHRDNACDCMRACDLYVSASSIEGMPFNIIEAMGCGKTVLASNVKGHADLIDDGECGFLYKYGSARQFADSVYAIYTGEKQADPEKIAARYKEYSEEEVFARTLDVIKEALKPDDGKM